MGGRGCSISDAPSPEANSFEPSRVRTTAPAAEPRVSSYRPDIDGLRAIAIILVLGFHFFPDAVPGGYIGVDVFFVISGFLITGIILGPLRRGEFSIRGFYARRVRRLYPALITVLAVSLAYGWFHLTPPKLELLGKHTIASAAFVPNLVYWREAGYFDIAAESKQLLHLWSLGLEEQFYIVWPLALYITTRLKLPAAAVLGMIAVLSFTACVVETRSDPSAAFYLPFTRAWELATGGLFAVGAREGWLDGLLLPARDVMSGFGLVLIAVAVVMFTGTTAFPGTAALLPAGGSALLIASGQGAAVNRGLAWRPMVWIGLISYPLYLWHWPLLSFAYVEASGIPSVETRAVFMGASFVLAALTYRIVERPFRRPGAPGWQIPCLVAGMAAVALAGAVLYRNEGFKSRFPISIQAILDIGKLTAGAGARPTRCWLDATTSYSGFAPECFLRADTASRDGTLIWGDSHSARLYVGVRAVLGDNANIGQLTRDDCPAVLIFPDYKVCEESNAMVMDMVREVKPRTVLIFGAWSARTTPEQWLQGAPVTNRFDTLVDNLQNAGVQRIVVIGPAPLWKGTLPELVFTDWQEQKGQKVVAERLPTARYTDVKGFDVDAAMRRATERHKGVKYVSLLDVLCNEKGCLTYPPDQPGKVFAFDYGHLTAEGATFVANKLLEDGLISR